MRVKESELYTVMRELFQKNPQQEYRIGALYDAVKQRGVRWTSLRAVENTVSRLAGEGKVILRWEVPNICVYRAKLS